MTSWTAACQVILSINNSWSLVKLISIKPVITSNHLILCHPILLLPSIFPSIRVFSNESVLWIRWPKYLSFSFSISPSHEFSGLTYFRIDRFDVLAVQRTLKSLLQHHSSKASVLWYTAFCMVQFSHPHMTTGKKHRLTRQTFHDRGLKCKNRYSKYTQSNRQIRPWSTKPSRANINRGLPREHTSHSKQSLLET